MAARSTSGLRAKFRATRVETAHAITLGVLSEHAPKYKSEGYYLSRTRLGSPNTDGLHLTSRDPVYGDNRALANNGGFNVINPGGERALYVHIPVFGKPVIHATPGEEGIARKIAAAFKAHAEYFFNPTIKKVRTAPDGALINDTSMADLASSATRLNRQSEARNRAEVRRQDAEFRASEALRKERESRRLH